MLERLEQLICLVGIASCVLLPAWYWLFHGQGRFHEYAEAKRIMAEKVIYDQRVTLYCQAPFDADKNAGYGFRAAGGEAVTWEHAVPVAAFGKNFSAWSEGDPQCRRKSGSFKGRRCAELVSPEFRQMAGDMYNLFPALAVVNSARGDRPYAELPKADAAFGGCRAKIAANAFEPPDAAKGQAARAALYMDAAYAQFSLKPAQKKLMEKWNSLFPVNARECQRARRIEKLQGNENIFVKTPCLAAGLWLRTVE